MQQLQVQGGVPLEGEVVLSGSKHSALAILGITLLMKGTLKLQNFPNISDTQHMLEIIKSLGVGVHVEEDVSLDVDAITFNEGEMWRISELRSSILFLGSLLVRFGSVQLPKPGGDKLGNRQMDEFLYVLSQFGIKYEETPEYIQAFLSQELKGHRIFDLCTKQFPEMGNNRTVLALILAWTNRGRTVLKNAIILPEITEACYFLEEISDGYVTIDGIGTDTLTVNSPGMKSIHKHDVCAEHVIGPDKCEYAFWIAATALTRGKVLLINPHASRDYRNNMRWLRAKLLRPAKVNMEVLSYETYNIDCLNQRTKSFTLNSTAHELHGIAFDATPLFATMLLNAEGIGSYYCFKFKHERVKWIKGLEQIGAKYVIKPKGRLVVIGAEQLHASEPVMLGGGDIRGASCVLLASLATQGSPIIFHGIEHVQRGMEMPLEKLQSLGAQIRNGELT